VGTLGDNGPSMSGEPTPSDTASAPPELAPPVDDEARDAGRRGPRWLWWALTAIVVVVALLATTSLTGLPAPGPLERYPVATLHDLVDAVHAEAGPLRTPDDCWRTTFRARRDDAPDGPPRPIAMVDWLRSRVVVRVHADAVGRVDARSAEAVRRRIAAVVAAHPEFEPGMVVTEASPDGWSPLMDCDRVTRGWL
jgi:hypothetical protein